jgi:hypothetical protein
MGTGKLAESDVQRRRILHLMFVRIESDDHVRSQGIWEFICAALMPVVHERILIRRGDDLPELPHVSFRQLRTYRCADPCPQCAKSSCEQLQQDRPLFEHLVGAGKKRRRHVDAERFRGSEIDN